VRSARIAAVAAAIGAMMLTALAAMTAAAQTPALSQPVQSSQEESVNELPAPPQPDLPATAPELEETTPLPAPGQPGVTPQLVEPAPEESMVVPQEVEPGLMAPESVQTVPPPVSPPGWFRPTPELPEPPGYPVLDMAPLPMRNRDPEAPPAQGVIYVFLPMPNATVYINGHMMLGVGTSRQYWTAVLYPSDMFRYAITAAYECQGDMVSETRVVDCGPGRYNVADFTRPARYNPTTLRPGPIDLTQAVPGP